MQKFGRLTLILIGGLSIFGAVLFLALNLYVQSQGTQARIQQELRQRFGATLKIGRVSVTPWSGLKLSGITIAQGTTGTSGNFLEAKNFGLRIAFFSLFSRRLVIKEVSLVSPNVVWPQNADGKWRLPDLRPERPENSPKNIVAATSSAEESEKAETPSETRVTAKPSKQPMPPPERKAIVPGAFISEIHKVSLINGNFRFLGRTSEPVANFEGVGFRAAVSNASSLHGNARVAKVSLRERFLLEQLKSPLRYDVNGLDLSQISAHLGGGDITGQFTMQPETEESPFRVEMKFRGVQADQIITEAGGPSGVLQGKLEGSLQTEGKTTDPDALTGNGEVFLHDGQLRQYNLLVALGQLFQIEELTQLHLDQAEAKYHLAPGVVTIDELVLRSTNIRLSATGTVSFRGKLHLSSRLAINEKVRAQLFKPIRTNFQPTEEPGYSAVDFEVSGTLERPKTNLLEKVVGRDLKDLVNSLWGGKTDKPKKKKGAQTNTDESTPPTSPEASTSPAAPSPTNSP
ncbi:MAG TPA: AsmA-like C-terminal region-containing protein [Chthoniobacterales bacterium]|nr:AsmA-like C-terminal region-containing protein [Chthoniobacterales bacterium]